MVGIIYEMLRIHFPMVNDYEYNFEQESKV